VLIRCKGFQLLRVGFDRWRLHDGKLNILSFRSLTGLIVKLYLLIECMSLQFSDGLVASAQEGGMAAVRRLRSNICDYVSTEFGLPSHIPIRVRIYANTKGLASAYCYNQILDGADDLVMFIRGFNMGNPMCDFVDAGDGKECADAKLKGNVAALLITSAVGEKYLVLIDAYLT